MTFRILSWYLLIVFNRIPKHIHGCGFWQKLLKDEIFRGKVLELNTPLMLAKLDNIFRIGSSIMIHNKYGGIWFTINSRMKSITQISAGHFAVASAISSSSHLCKNQILVSLIRCESWTHWIFRSCCKVGTLSISRSYKVQCKSPNSVTCGPWQFVLINKSTN